MVHAHPLEGVVADGAEIGAVHVDVDDLIAKFFGCRFVEYQRAVEVLAALHGKFNAALLQNGIDARECGLRSLEARALADARADHLT